jgi:hypothetical protein
MASSSFPAALRSAGRTSKRILAARFCCARVLQLCRSPDERQRHPGPAFQLPYPPRISRSLSSGRPLRAGPVGLSGLQQQQKGSGTPAGAFVSMFRISGCGARPAGRARLSAFHRGSCRRGFRPSGATPGQASWDVTRAPDPVSPPQPGGGDLAPLTRALPALACPSPGNAPPGPVVVPVSMMPEAARERSVSFRPRAPHSLRIREYPRPKASVDERDSRACNGSGDDCQGCRVSRDPYESSRSPD